MTTTHTPGPWKVIENEWIDSPNGEQVAELFETHPANAALIAAAPDLLNAAKDVLEQFQKTLLPVGADLSDSIRVFLAQAIAKAEGR